MDTDVSFHGEWAMSDSVLKWNMTHGLAFHSKHLDQGCGLSRVGREVDGGGRIPVEIPVQGRLGTLVNPYKDRWSKSKTTWFLFFLVFLQPMSGAAKWATISCILCALRYILSTCTPLFIVSVYRFWSVHVAQARMFGSTAWPNIVWMRRQKYLPFLEQSSPRKYIGFITV